MEAFISNKLSSQMSTKHDNLGINHSLILARTFNIHHVFKFNCKYETEKICTLLLLF